MSPELVYDNMILKKKILHNYVWARKNPFGSVDFLE